MKVFFVFVFFHFKSTPTLNSDGPSSTCGWLLKEWRDQFKKHIRLGSDLLPNQLKRRAALKFHEGKEKKNLYLSFCKRAVGRSLVG